MPRWTTRRSTIGENENAALAEATPQRHTTLSPACRFVILLAARVICAFEVTPLCCASPPLIGIHTTLVLPAAGMLYRRPPPAARSSAALHVFARVLLSFQAGHSKLSPQNKSLLSSALYSPARRGRAQAFRGEHCSIIREHFSAARARHDDDAGRHRFAAGSRQRRLVAWHDYYIASCWLRAHHAA